MARSLDQILSELGSVYDPQVASIRQQQSLIPQQVADEEQGLQAKQTQAFGDILSGARQRGLGFSGIPLSEQAKYTSTEFLPAIAKLKSNARQQSLSLEDAILGINERRTNSALGLRQQDIDNDYRQQQLAEQQRQFNEQLAQSRAAAASANSFSPTLGGGGGQAPAAQDPLKARAFAAVSDLLGTKNTGLISKTYDAIRKSAGYGNAYDKLKLQLLETLYPQVRTLNSGAPIRLQPAQPTVVARLR